MEIQIGSAVGFVPQAESIVVIGVFEEDVLTGLAAEYNTDGKIAALINAGDFKPKLGSTFTDFSNGRLLLVGLGKKDKFDRHSFNKAAAVVANSLKGRAFNSTLVRLVECNNTQYDTELDALRAMVIALRTAEYSYEVYKTKNVEPVVFPSSVTLTLTNDVDPVFAKDALETAEAIAAGMRFTKDLGNTPANICTPTWLSEQATSLISSNVEVTVLGQPEIETMNMGSFLAVAQGSIEPPKLIVVQYRGSDDISEKPIALVGKGITFDTGGISIKPSGAMDEMKYDMMGAASVLGTIKAIAQMGLKKNVVAIVPSCENMPSHNAVKPGDIVKSMSGQTIEILNTDAEGRLILCDALTYAQEKFEPEIIVDVATLTGAILVALGSVHSGLFTKDDDLAKALVDAGYGAMDTVWRMPMDQEFDEMLKSPFADMANIGGGREGGSSSAACFLARFTEGTRWAHLDVAGTASKGGKDKGATGRPVPLLVQFLIDQSK